MNDPAATNTNPDEKKNRMRKKIATGTALLRWSHLFYINLCTAACLCVVNSAHRWMAEFLQVLCMV